MHFFVGWGLEDLLDCAELVPVSGRQLVCLVVRIIKCLLGSLGEGFWWS
jgi:hypothetical protein